MNIGMITVSQAHQGEEEENGQREEHPSLDDCLGHPQDHAQHHPGLPQPRVVWNFNDEGATSHLEYIMDAEDEEEEQRQHQGWSEDAQRWLHPIISQKMSGKKKKENGVRETGIIKINSMNGNKMNIENEAIKKKIL